MDSENKANQVSGPLPETMPGPMLVRMLEVVPSKGSEGGDKEATTFSKEVVRKGGIKNSSPQGKKGTASEDSETMALKWGKKSSPEGPVLGDTSDELCPQGDQPSTKP